MWVHSVQHGVMNDSFTILPMFNVDKYIVLGNSLFVCHLVFSKDIITLCMVVYDIVVYDIVVYNVVWYCGLCYCGLWYCDL